MIEELRKDLFIKTESFVRSLDGFYGKHLSDEFMALYLRKEFHDIYQDRPRTGLSNIAYRAAVVLFESLLEHGCDYRRNGHHVAQSYASLFPDANAEEFYKDSFRDEKINNIIRE